MLDEDSMLDCCKGIEREPADNPTATATVRSPLLGTNKLELWFQADRNCFRPKKLEQQIQTRAWTNVGSFGKKQSHWLFEPLILTEPLFPWLFGPAQNNDRSERADSGWAATQWPKPNKGAEWLKTLNSVWASCLRFLIFLKGKVANMRIAMHNMSSAILYPASVPPTVRL